MEKIFITEDGRIITKRELEKIASLVEDEHILDMEIFNYHTCQGNAPQRQPRDLRENGIKRTMALFYKKLGIPENYFD